MTATSPTKRWWLVIALLLSLGVNIGILLTLAAGRGDEPAPAAVEEEKEEPESGIPPALPPILSRLADRFELTGERRERFLALQRELVRVSLEARRQRFRLQRELRRELVAAEPDRRHAEQLVDELARTYRVQEGTLARTVLDTRELLGEEQEREYLHFLGRLRTRMEQGLRQRLPEPPGSAQRRGPGRRRPPEMGSPPPGRRQATPLE